MRIVPGAAAIPQRCRSATNSVSLKAREAVGRPAGTKTMTMTIVGRAVAGIAVDRPAIAAETAEAINPETKAGSSPAREAVSRRHQAAIKTTMMITAEAALGVRLRRRAVQDNAGC